MRRKKAIAALAAIAVMAITAPAAFAANGVSHSQGASSHGNAVSSGATPQPQ
jgi:hypothetical protein